MIVDPPTRLIRSAIGTLRGWKKKSSFVKPLTTRFVGYLQYPGHDFWKETFKCIFSALSTTSRVSSASVSFETNLIVSKTQQLTTTGGGICISTHLAQRSQHAWSSSVLCRYRWSPVHTWTFCIGGKQRTCVWLLIKAAAVVCVRRGLPPG